MSITGGACPPFPSRAGSTPVKEACDRLHPMVSEAPRGRRWLRHAALASAGALGAWAVPAMAAPADHGAYLAYAPIDAMQAADSALLIPPVIVAPPAPADAAAPASTPSATTGTEASAPPAPATAAPDGAAPATTPNAAPDKPAHAGGQHDIIVSGDRKAPAGDPLEGINLKTYAVVQAADKAVVGPAAMAYKKHLPSPLRRGFHNVLFNLREPAVAVAFLVEHKFGKAFETIGRLAINSTIGIAGLMDVAKRKPFNLPWRPNGLADAMGFYGIKPGPYFFLPLIGPTTLRDVIGTTIDRVGFPALYAEELRGPAYGLAVTIIGGLDDRVSIDPQVRVFHDAPDPYGAMRRYYLQRRQAEIDGLHGKYTRPITPEEAAFGPSAAPDAAKAADGTAAAPAATAPSLGGGLLMPPIIEEPAPAASTPAVPASQPDTAPATQPASPPAPANP